jgi:hypothetical protein
MGRTTLKSDSAHGNFHFGNGTTAFTPPFPLLDLGKFSRLSDFTINAPNVKIDPEVRMIVERESERLRLKNLKYSSSEETDWQLALIMESANGLKDNAKTKLAQDGKSAVVSEVSKAINASSLDHSSKYILSNQPFYVYALSYSIYFEKVSDAVGLDDRVIVTTENKIKTHINKLLAEKVIKDNHLDLTEAQKRKILLAAETTNISFIAGEPIRAINKIISKFVEYGSLHALVDKFFESGEIDPAKGTPQVRQLMVNYLIEIGLKLKPDSPSAEEGPVRESPAENSPRRNPIKSV